MINMNLFKTKKQKELMILEEYLEKVKDHPYRESKKHLINMLNWLINYYNNKTANTPKAYLEAMINYPMTFSISKEHKEELALLYNWVYYKKIVGF